MPIDFDIDLEMAIMEREAYERVVAKMRASQLGEAWVGLDDRRAELSPIRGSDRRSGRDAQV
jgi:hypothetical protein